MKYQVDVLQYEDSANGEDEGNGCYFLAVHESGVKELDVDKNYYSLEISEKFEIDFSEMVVKHGGFLDGIDLFFPYKYQAETCKRELKALINK